VAVHTFCPWIMAVYCKFMGIHIERNTVVAQWLEHRLGWTRLLHASVGQEPSMWKMAKTQTIQPSELINTNDIYPRCSLKVLLSPEVVPKGNYCGTSLSRDAGFTSGEPIPGCLILGGVTTPEN
jgi:hypothetical protein